MDICKYCLRLYSDNRLPLILQCKHVICRNCLKFLRKNSFTQCPKCKVRDKRKLQDIKINHYLQKPKNNQKLLMCQNHKSPIKYYSKTLYKNACEICIKNKLDLDPQIKQIINNSFIEIAEKESFLKAELEIKQKNLEITKSLYLGRKQIIQSLISMLNHIKCVKKINEIFPKNFIELDFSEKLSLVRNSQIFLYKENSEFCKKLENLDSESFQNDFLRLLSILRYGKKNIIEF